MTPDEFTIKELYIKVSGGHKIYVHIWGNKKSNIPILHLHGGPGAGCNNRDKYKYNPTSHKVIFLDQRGAGRSQPNGKLDKNKTPDLLSDIDKLLDKLKISTVILSGGSWGSALALFYAIARPTKVKAIMLSGVYLATKTENDWLINGGWRDFYPDLWEEYQKSVPIAYQKNPSDYHLKRVFNNNKLISKKATYEFMKINTALLKLDERFRPEEFDKFNESAGKIELHYLVNNNFMPDNYIINNVKKLTMPIYIIQGRYDMITRPINAYKLYKLINQTEIYWTINGHINQHEAKNIQQLILKQITELK